MKSLALVFYILLASCEFYAQNGVVVPDPLLELHKVYLEKKENMSLTITMTQGEGCASGEEGMRQTTVSFYLKGAMYSKGENWEMLQNEKVYVFVNHERKLVYVSDMPDDESFALPSGFSIDKLQKSLANYAEIEITESDGMRTLHAEGKASHQPDMVMQFTTENVLKRVLLRTKYLGDCIEYKFSEEVGKVTKKSVAESNLILRTNQNIQLVPRLSGYKLIY